MRSFAPAKVNLFLRVIGRRADGYHLLDSLAVFPAVGDVLTAEPAPGLKLALEGPFAAALAHDPDNLVLRAVRALRPGLGAALRLTKNLPVASGIGGGSADAAAALRLCVRLWDVAGESGRGGGDAGGFPGADGRIFGARGTARGLGGCGGDGGGSGQAGQ
jgi:4-diphosphocytidyl-2-C-methyl-D-erythritol kinase